MHLKYNCPPWDLLSQITRSMHFHQKQKFISILNTSLNCILWKHTKKMLKWTPLSMSLQSVNKRLCLLSILSSWHLVLHVTLTESLFSALLPSFRIQAGYSISLAWAKILMCVYVCVCVTLWKFHSEMHWFVWSMSSIIIKRKGNYF